MDEAALVHGDRPETDQRQPDHDERHPERTNDPPCHARPALEVDREVVGERRQHDAGRDHGEVEGGRRRLGAHAERAEVRLPPSRVVGAQRRGDDTGPEEGAEQHGHAGAAHLLRDVRQEVAAGGHSRCRHQGRSDPTQQEPLEHPLEDGERGERRHDRHGRCGDREGGRVPYPPDDRPAPPPYGPACDAYVRGRERRPAQHGHEDRGHGRDRHLPGQRRARLAEHEGADDHRDRAATHRHELCDGLACTDLPRRPAQHGPDPQHIPATHA